MKKMVIGMIAAAMAISAYSKTRDDIALDNARIWADTQSIPLESVMDWKALHGYNENIRTQCDEIVSGKITAENSRGFLNKYSKAWRFIGIEKYCPKTAAAVASANGYEVYGAVLSGKRQIPDKTSMGADFISYVCEREYFVRIYSFDEVVNSIQKACLYAVRRTLRSKGISFVAKNGSDPQREYMSRIAGCLNAPRFSGLAGVLSEIGLGGARVDAMNWAMTDADVKMLKEKVLYGEAEFDRIRQCILRFNLGVEAYNAFVREYNGK